MSKLIVMALPILPGKTEVAHQFIEEIRTNRFREFQESREQHGVRERVFLQETPAGALAIVALEGENPEEAMRNFGQGTDEFTKWFIGKVKEIHGLDLTAPPVGELPRLMIDSKQMQPA